MTLLPCFVALSACSTTPAEPGNAVAPKPLFVDLTFHGSCDPEIVYSEATDEWLIYYTARRALAEDGNAPAATPIGVARSDDWATWDFAGDHLVEPGQHETDRGLARHPSVAVVDDRAFVVYHCEPHRPEGPYHQVSIQQRRTYLQVAELKLINNEPTINRDAPVELPNLK